MGVKLKKRIVEVGNQAIIPKEITINGYKQKPKIEDTVRVEEEKIVFDKRATVDWHYLEGERAGPVSWNDNRRYFWAPVTGASGGAGGAGGSSVAVSRLNVIDPHLILMMRDVMDSAESVARLKIGASAGGGGGGGGVTENNGAVQTGWTPHAGPGTNAEPNMYDTSVDAVVSHSINTNSATGGGDGGAGYAEDIDYAGGAGGGGAGGNGGAVVLITTTSGDATGSIDASGGIFGEGGLKASQQEAADTAGEDGEPGNAGSIITIVI